MKYIGVESHRGLTQSTRTWSTWRGNVHRVQRSDHPNPRIGETPGRDTTSPPPWEAMLTAARWASASWSIPTKPAFSTLGRARGALKSTDSAATWAKVASFPVTGTNPYGLSFVVFDKTSGTRATARRPSTWAWLPQQRAPICTARSTRASPGRCDRKRPAFRSDAPPRVLASDGNLWIAYNSSSGPNSITSGAVWKLNTAGDTWTNVNPTGHGAVLAESACRHRTPIMPWPNPGLVGPG